MKQEQICNKQLTIFLPSAIATDNDVIRPGVNQTKRALVLVPNILKASNEAWATPRLVFFRVFNLNLSTSISSLLTWELPPHPRQGCGIHHAESNVLRRLEKYITCK